MSKGLLIWLDSGANIHSNNKQELTWDELGITEEEWDEKTEEEQEDFAKVIAFDRMEWGYKKR